MFSRRQFLAASGAGLLAGCSPAKGRAQDADVIIIGAGLSGLQAAMILAAEGLKPLVLEASTRIGGRLMTLDDVPGRPDGGGQQVGQTYARIRRAALDLGIDITPFPKHDRRALMSVGGALIEPEDWASAPQNPFPEVLKKLTPSSALFAAAIQENPFEDVYAWREVSDTGDITAEAFLSAQGFDAASLKLIDHTLNANQLGTYSMANVWRSLRLYLQDSAMGPSEGIAGGAQRLPEAMAASLPEGSVKLGEAVNAIEATDNTVTIRAGRNTYRAPFAISSLPFSVMRNLAVEAPLSQVHRAAIAALPYTQINQVHVSLETPITDGLPSDMWTDTPMERLFTTYDESGEPIGFTCWINGTGARSEPSDAEWMELATRTLQEVRGLKVKAQKVVRWDKSNPLAGGAYMHWAPGQIKPWAGKMAEPAGRLYFAGEHLSHLHTGLEGAMEAGEAAAMSALEAMLA